MRNHVRMLHEVREPKEEIFPMEMVANIGYVSPRGMKGPTAKTTKAAKETKTARTEKNTKSKKRKSKGYIEMYRTDKERPQSKERKMEEKKKTTEEKKTEVVEKANQERLLVTVDVNVNEEKDNLVKRLNEINKEKDRLRVEEARVRGELQLLEVQKWRERFYKLLDENKMKEEVKGLKERVKQLECKSASEEESEFKRMYGGMEVVAKGQQKVEQETIFKLHFIYFKDILKERHSNRFMLQFYFVLHRIAVICEIF